MLQTAFSTAFTDIDVPMIWTLLLLGGTALLGFSYVSYEIIQHRRRSAAAHRRGYNPYVSGQPVRSAKMFYGRRQLLQRIIDTLHNNSLLLHGERRIGKTTLLLQLARRLRTIDDPLYWFLPVYADLEGTNEREFFHYLMEEIDHVAAAWIGTAPLNGRDGLRLHALAAADYREQDFSRDLGACVEGLQDYGARAHPGKQLRLILLMDEMDAVGRYDRAVQQQLRRIFMRDVSSTLGVVAAGIRINKTWDRAESPWYNFFNEIEVTPFDGVAALALLLEPVRDVYRYEGAAVDFILKQSRGRPYRIQQYGLGAVNEMLAAGRRRITLGDAEAAHHALTFRYATEDARAELGSAHVALLGGGAVHAERGSRSHGAARVAGRRPESKSPGWHRAPHQWGWPA